MEKINNMEMFNKTINDTKKVVVDFYADWCGPCKMLEPIFEKVSKEIKDVKFTKVNVDNLQEPSKIFKVASIPTIIIFQNGKEIKRNVGFLSEDGLKELIK